MVVIFKRDIVLPKNDSLAHGVNLVNMCRAWYFFDNSNWFLKTYKPPFKTHYSYGGFDIGISVLLIVIYGGHFQAGIDLISDDTLAHGANPLKSRKCHNVLNSISQRQVTNWSD